MIIKTFSEKHEFPQTMRLTRVVYILIKQFSEILVRPRKGIYTLQGTQLIIAIFIQGYRM
jgi:hypothetical protein